LTNRLTTRGPNLNPNRPTTRVVYDRPTSLEFRGKKLTLIHSWP